MLKSENFKKLMSGDYTLYEMKKGKDKKVVMLATILPNSTLLHDELKVGHNIEIYHLNPENKEIVEHEIIYLSS